MDVRVQVGVGKRWSLYNPLLSVPRRRARLARLSLTTQHCASNSNTTSLSFVNGDMLSMFLVILGTSNKSFNSNY